MSELYLPCLPEFELQSDIEIDLHGCDVSFTLSYGAVSVDCCMDGMVKIENFDVAVDSNPQNNLERPFEFLVVSNTPVEVLRTDIDLVGGQRIKLTEKQMVKLREYLKDEMVMV
ncbi:MAG: hypothetical protein RSE18_00520 [Acinetobacter sp.]